VWAFPLGGEEGTICGQSCAILGLFNLNRTPRP
jgi:hypothetical protein